MRGILSRTVKLLLSIFFMFLFSCAFLLNIAFGYILFGDINTGFTYLDRLYGKWEDWM